MTTRYFVRVYVSYKNHPGNCKNPALFRVSKMKCSKQPPLNVKKLSVSTKTYFLTTARGKGKKLYVQQ
mgnify:FL=1